MLSLAGHYGRQAGYGKKEGEPPARGCSNFNYFLCHVNGTLLLIAVSVKVDLAVLASFLVRVFFPVYPGYQPYLVPFAAPA